MRPLPDDPVGELRGKYRDRLPSTESIRQVDRDAEVADEVGE